jgi:hypothetical protein
LEVGRGQARALSAWAKALVAHEFFVGIDFVASPRQLEDDQAGRHLKAGF